MAKNPPGANIETLYAGKYLSLLRDGHWEYAQRPHSTGAAFIVAITAARELVLVEQYRIPLHARCIELPAGIIGDEAAFADEEVGAAALRELEEETGFRGSRAEVLTSGPVGAGLTSEILHLVRVHDIERVGAGGGVEGENITVHVVPLEGIGGWLLRQSKSGLWIEPRVYAALWFVENQLKS